MSALALQTIAQAGLTPAFVAAAAGGDSFPNNIDERTFLVVKNAGGSPVTVTINPQITQAKVSGLGTLPVQAVQVSVPATNGEKWIGPFPAGFSDAGGNVSVGYSAVTSVTVAAVRLPPLSY